MAPKTRQRNAVRISIDKPRSRSIGGASVSKPVKSAITRTAPASRNRAEDVIMRELRRFVV